MRLAGFRFEVFTADFDESFPDSLPATEVAEFLAKAKNQYYQSLLSGKLILTADTTVVLGNEVINKPADEAEARYMLSKLSGQTHLVVSGVCISDASKTISFSDVTKVHFAPVSAEEISTYVERYQPLDKAGAYGVQEWVGLTKVTGMEGSYFNVMGLPIHRVYETLKNEFGLLPSF